ncbi:unnamed protein product [Caenorhabditis brenneri]
MLPKFVVVEVTNPMSLVEYLVAHGFEKFSVVSDLMDHPSFRTVTPEAPLEPEPSPPTSNKPRASLESIAQALSANLAISTSEPNVEPYLHHSMLQFLHPLPFPFEVPNTITDAFGTQSPGKMKQKHRWLPHCELEESRTSKKYGRVHCKATYKCQLCGKPTTLNSTGSRWNLLRHVIMIHSESKPYKCWDCNFTGIKSNVLSHAKQCRHRLIDPCDNTTDEMRAEWNVLLHECFPEYIRAKERGWLPVDGGSPEKEDGDEESDSS